MSYRRTLKFVVQRIEGLWSEDGELIGEEPQPTEVVYYPFDLRELDDRAARKGRAGDGEAGRRGDEARR